jgi:ketosteroid isomerase-like protein
MKEHENAARVRAAYDAMWQHGDSAPLVTLMDDDIVWINDVGAGPWRELQGAQVVMEGLGQWMALFDGGFSQEVLDVCGGDHNVVVVLREAGTARGHRFDNIALYRYEFGASGKVVRVRTYDESREAITAFWDAVGPVSATG